MWWTIEQVAEHTGLTVDQVRHTRSRREWPGNLGIRQGRRLRFDSERVQEGPREAEHTDDAATATVWLLEDIRNLVGQIHAAVNDLRAWEAARRTLVYSTDDGKTWTTAEERADDGTD